MSGHCLSTLFEVVTATELYLFVPSADVAVIALLGYPVIFSWALHSDVSHECEDYYTVRDSCPHAALLSHHLQGGAAECMPRSI